MGGAFNYWVSLSATATGHTTPNDAGVRRCRETSSHRKENSRLPQRQKGKWVVPKGRARRHLHTKYFSPCDREAEGGFCASLLCVPSIQELVPGKQVSELWVTFNN